MPKLTVAVITRNEAANIDAALASVAWADELLVVDSESTDATAAIARQRGARVVPRAWPGYSVQKNYAASVASHDWILSIDADERVSPELASEIRHVLSGIQTDAAIECRASPGTGRWIRTTDWYPDYQLRLYDRRSAQWADRRVHESVRLTDGEPGQLRHPLLHFAYRDISDHLGTIDKYTTLAARQWAEEGRRTSIAGVMVQPPFAFVRNYVLRRGFMDGSAGFIVSVLNSYYVFLKLAKLWELNRNQASDAAGHESAVSDLDLRTSRPDRR